MKKEGVTLEEILVWIVSNGDNIDAMEKINRLSYQFTRKYRGKQNE